MKFREGKVTEKLRVEKNGKQLEIIIRFPGKNDLRIIHAFYNKVVKETEFLSRVTPVSLREEKKWLDNVLKGVRKGDKIQLLAECNGRVIGSASVERKSEQRRTHTAGFGICILREFTGLGLGKSMMTSIEKEARKTDLKILELSVFGKNRIAQNLYKKMGFKVTGKIPHAVKIRKGYDDDILMYKVLK